MVGALDGGRQVYEPSDLDQDYEQTPTSDEVSDEFIDESEFYNRIQKKRCISTPRKPTPGTTAVPPVAPAVSPAASAIPTSDPAAPVVLLTDPDVSPTVSRGHKKRRGATSRRARETVSPAVPAIHPVDHAVPPNDPVVSPAGPAFPPATHADTAALPVDPAVPPFGRRRRRHAVDDGDDDASRIVYFETSTLSSKSGFRWNCRPQTPRAARTPARNIVSPFTPGPAPEARSADTTEKAMKLLCDDDIINEIAKWKQQNNSNRGSQIHLSKSNDVSDRASRGASTIGGTDHQWLPEGQPPVHQGNV
ncbi:hypothetical protein Pcinc_020443 [Petrolisthes cinctipes]|uniref:Uncharacterized protein n=1 Tax=Petrolisthes cinctipes TaxID=88211 RepID=A0AAE1FML0_PETCI|nr:hypothetical protein Pcinc_020443 [Petrolisthes cinctipes]